MPFVRRPRSRPLASLRLPLLLLLPLGLLWLPCAGVTAGEEEGRGLRLEARVPASVTSGDLVPFQATFRNLAAADVELLLPLHVGAVHFPQWLLVDEAFARWTPHQSPFQSMWKSGLQGDLLRLGAGAEKVFAFQSSRFVRWEDGKPAAGDAVPLPPGHYAVRARYVKETDEVLWSSKAFETHPRRHEGLWTGTLESETALLEVRPSTRPVLELEGEDVVYAGRAAPLTIRLRNEGKEALRLRGAFVVSVGAKAWGSGSLRLVPRADGHRIALGTDDVEDLVLEPGAVRKTTIDLDASTFRRIVRPRYGSPRPDPASPESREHHVGLYDLVPQGLFSLAVSWIEEGAERALAYQGGFRRVAPLEAGAVQGLSLRLESAFSADGPLLVTAVLTNDGETPVCVPAALAYPKHLYFRLERAASTEDLVHAISRQARSDPRSLMDPDEPGREAVLPRGMAWDGDRFEPAVRLDRVTVAELATGASLRRTFRLADLVGKGEAGLGAQAWRVQAFWRNRDAGRRLGLEPPLAVGLLVGEPIVVGGRGR